MATAQRTAVGASGPRDIVGPTLAELLSRGATHRQHRGQRSNLPAGWPDFPKPSSRAANSPAQGVPPTAAGAHLPFRRPPRTLPLSPGPRRPLGAPRCGHTWPQSRPGRRLPPRSPPPAPRRPRRAGPFVSRGQVPGPAAGPPSGRAHCSPDLFAARGAAGGRLAFIPREGHRAGRAQGPSGLRQAASGRAGVGAAAPARVGSSPEGRERSGVFATGRAGRGRCATPTRGGGPSKPLGRNLAHRGIAARRRWRRGVSERVRARPPAAGRREARSPLRQRSASFSAAASPAHSYPSRAGAAAVASASSLGPRAPLPEAEEGAGTPQKEPTRRAPARRLRPGSDCPPPAAAAAAAAASARIRARLGHRAIITGARGDVTRTPAPPPPPRGVLENCGGTRAAHTRTHALRARCLPRTLAASRPARSSAHSDAALERPRPSLAPQGHASAPGNPTGRSPSERTLTPTNHASAARSLVSPADAPPHSACAAGSSPQFSPRHTLCTVTLPAPPAPRGRKGTCRGPLGGYLEDGEQIPLTLPPCEYGPVPPSGPTPALREPWGSKADWEGGGTRRGSALNPPSPAPHEGLVGEDPAGPEAQLSCWVIGPWTLPGLHQQASRGRSSPAPTKAPSPVTEARVAALPQAPLCAPFSLGSERPRQGVHPGSTGARAGPDRDSRRRQWLDSDGSRRPLLGWLQSQTWASGSLGHGGDQSGLLGRWLNLAPPSEILMDPQGQEGKRGPPEGAPSSGGQGAVRGAAQVARELSPTQQRQVSCEGDPPVTGPPSLMVSAGLGVVLARCLPCAPGKSPLCSGLLDPVLAGSGLHIPCPLHLPRPIAEPVHPPLRCDPPAGPPPATLCWGPTLSAPHLLAVSSLCCPPGCQPALHPSWPGGGLRAAMATPGWLPGKSPLLPLFPSGPSR
ncbi:collagen alpha-1(I) chain-like [Mesoplodon densirostris]|uniref:collagen alpha-1(I) chain-like n=1 Tax=Mesoplodon densirostris TaxID=48708 RepID=UPI0028DCF51A|nr:collagen alpha-1(I) chain-like [Mesoplodon densirostris]